MSSWVLPLPLVPAVSRSHRTFDPLMCSACTRALLRHISCACAVVSDVRDMDHGGDDTHLILQVRHPVRTTSGGESVNACHHHRPEAVISSDQHSPLWCVFLVRLSFSTPAGSMMTVAVTAIVKY